MVFIDTNSNAVQEDLIIASHPTIDKCSGVQINLYLKLTKKNYPKLTLSIHPSIHLTYHKNCISNLHYLSIHLSILPSIHTSDLPQELSQTYTNIHPAYLKLTLIHPSIHPSCIANLHPPSIHLTQNLYLTYTIYPSKYHPSIHLTYHKNYLKLTLIHPSIHTSDLPQKLSQTYTNPLISNFTSIHLSILPLSQTYTIHPSAFQKNCISNLNYPFTIHPHIHLTYHNNYLKLTLMHPSIHISIHLTYTKISNPSILPIYIPNPSIPPVSQTYTIYPSFLPSIHTSDLPQKLLSQISI